MDCKTLNGLFPNEYNDIHPVRTLRDAAQHLSAEFFLGKIGHQMWHMKSKSKTKRTILLKHVRKLLNKKTIPKERHRKGSKSEDIHIENMELIRKR